MSKSVYTAIGAGIVIISLATFFMYSADQAKVRGFNFGNDLQQIQDELKQVQNEFYSKKIQLDERNIDRNEFLDFSETHTQKMAEIIDRYDTLQPPEPFAPSVKIFRFSTQKQLESDEQLIEWIRTNNTSAKVLSDLLLQEAFESELAALASYDKAKSSVPGS